MYFPGVAAAVRRHGAVATRAVDRQEGPDVLPDVKAGSPNGVRGEGFVLSLDGRPVARTAPHDARMECPRDRGGRHAFPERRTSPILCACPPESCTGRQSPVR
jgi:antitoxin (DNA-binding transcriptional repressor) of toxin-antitoxin stability system